MSRHESRTFGEILIAGSTDATKSVTVLLRDSDGLVQLCSGNTVPGAVAGFSRGAIFIHKDAGGGLGALMENVGTTSAALFRSIKPGGTGFSFVAGGNFTALTGNATQAILIGGKDPCVATDIAFAHMHTSDDTDTLNSIISAANQITVVESADPLAAHKYDYALVRQGALLPSHLIYAAGRFTTVGGGATETITVSGMLASDVVILQLHTKGGTPRTIVKAAAAAGQINVTMSGDSLTTHIITYMILRARDIVPSHYIFAAGSQDGTNGSANQTITVSGMLATDQAFVVYNTTDDTDTVVTVQPAAGQINVVLSADPLAAHKLSYLVIRAY